MEGGGTYTVCLTRAETLTLTVEVEAEGPAAAVRKALAQAQGDDGAWLDAERGAPSGRVHVAWASNGAGLVEVEAGLREPRPEAAVRALEALEGRALEPEAAGLVREALEALGRERGEAGAAGAGRRHTVDRTMLVWTLAQAWAAYRDRAAARRKGAGYGAVQAARAEGRLEEARGRWRALEDACPKAAAEVRRGWEADEGAWAAHVLGEGLEAEEVGEACGGRFEWRGLHRIVAAGDTYPSRSVLGRKGRWRADLKAWEWQGEEAVRAALALARPERD